ncbi:MAG: hypothetical protein KKH93_02870 [Candidatus Omnitrophica bacterium]|nr:hypothetical protein [Candidatus Omnitrophota bacterium]MBU2043733.1 hypothetical protein [Candidatus Omnitrophota bacterium]MBU2251472.1 hypothetical protein [Candidatus Omnitrophota bacterium]MBU2265657.1 hypothetical protein [Candidatus Omnitrophota bacterium]MBU2474043.1 hypothetical protein [Candidatus Omnitrophota bacterium]
MKLKLPETTFFNFLKQYPRISSLVGLILLVMLLSLPISLKAKFRVVVVSAVLGFSIALGMRYFLTRRKKNGRDI